MEENNVTTIPPENLLCIYSPQSFVADPFKIEDLVSFSSHHFLIAWKEQRPSDVSPCNWRVMRSGVHGETFNSGQWISGSALSLLLFTYWLLKPGSRLFSSLCILICHFPSTLRALALVKTVKPQYHCRGQRVLMESGLLIFWTCLLHCIMAGEFPLMSSSLFHSSIKTYHNFPPFTTVQERPLLDF